MIGYTWYNNGSVEKPFSAESKIPDGFLKGKLKRIWVTNGIEDKKILANEDIPSGYVKGRHNGCEGLNLNGKTAYNNGARQIFLEENEKVPDGFNKGGLSFTETHKKKISLKLKEYQRTEEHKTNLKAALSSKEHKEKIRQTLMSKYGVDNPALIKGAAEKSKQTMLKKYNVEHYAQTGLNRPAKYEFDGERFDSSWELYYYIYAKYILCKNVKREPKKLNFLFNGKEHIYIPDFEVDGQLEEVKGSHFFKKDGTMCNPFDRSEDALYEAKHRCMIENDVKIITDVTEIKRKVDEVFTEDFVPSFEVRKK